MASVHSLNKMHGNPVFQQSDQKCYDSHIVVSLSQYLCEFALCLLTDDPSRWCCPCWRMKDFSLENVISVNFQIIYVKICALFLWKGTLTCMLGWTSYVGNYPEPLGMSLSYVLYLVALPDPHISQ